MHLVPGPIRHRIEHRPALLKIVDNIGWLFLDKFLRLGLGLLVGVWLARYLGPAQFGLLSFAQAFVGLFAAVATLGLQGIVVRDIVREPESAPLTLGTAAVLQMVSGLVAYLALLAAITWLRADDPLARLIVAILGSSLLFKASEIAVYWFESQVQSKYTVWVQNGICLLSAAAKAAFILARAPLLAFVWVAFAEMFLVAFFLIVAMGWRGPPLSSLRADAARAKMLLKDCWPLVLSSIAVMIYMRIDQVMLGQMVGDEAVGIYSAAVRISEVWYFIPMAVASSVFPSIIEAKKIGEEEYYSRLQKLYDLMALMSVGVALPMTFLAEPLTGLLYGRLYHGAAPVLAIHIWASVFVFLGVASSRWFLVEGKQILTLQKTLLGALCNVGLNFFLIPSYSAIGAAVATFLSQGASAFLSDLLFKETRKMFRMKASSMNLITSISRITRALFRTQK
ncbi:flippase [Dissulfurirhabdus thermomarina]|uniref:Flippase n=1 Tax=Dissulfurirhabdus thermomarina TaxID=1765737 RepID=A0A6N9TS81_DISTH|nr:flippase [Dissulfurirhabdus thermomarina]NDY42307.1 flippase [Dissulfurirhabdus thermomarina]NMX24166.1 flippase [Dissulfurirhabdus thermomarina]